MAMAVSKYGVIQSSTLGPHYCFCYTQIIYPELPSTDIPWKIIMFADGTAIVIQGESWDSVIAQANLAVSRVMKF